MPTKTIRDMLGRELTVPQAAQRIISLCPSQTETLFDLGAGSRMVGVTRYCVHPQEKGAAVQKVGGTKKLDMDLVRALSPDLIIAEKEENPREMVEALSETAPVYVTDVADLRSAVEMIRRLGTLIAESARADQLASDIESLTEQHAHPGPPRGRCAYLIWNRPLMVAGRGTFIDAMVGLAGWENAFTGERYPEVSWDDLRAARLSEVWLSSEPFPFQEKHVEEFKAELPGVRVRRVDGEAFSWYGSRMLQSIPQITRDYSRYEPAK